MKILHVVSGGELGGSRKHIVTLLAKFPRDEVDLLVFQEGKLAEEARKEGIHVHILQQKSRYHLAVLRRYGALIKNEGYDIVHTHGPRANFFTYLIKNSIAGKWVTTIHSDPNLDFINGKWQGRIFTKVHLYAMKKVDIFFAISKEFQKTLLELGVQEQRIIPIYNGIDYRSPVKYPLKLKEQLGILSDDFVVVHVARLHPIKGHMTLFEAICDLDIDRLKVLLIGDGPLKKELMNQVKTLNLAEKVMFLGFREDVESLLRLADVQVLTSYSESFPLVLLEGAGQKTTCIATNVGGVGELIYDKSVGWLIQPRDAEMLRTALLEAYICKQHGELKRKGERVYGHAVSCFSLDRLYQHVRLVYEGVAT